MTSGAQVGGIPYPLRARRLRIVDVEVLSASMRRVVLSGPDLEAELPFHRLAATDHVKVLLPDERSGTVHPPEHDAGIRGLGPDAVVRDYTIRHVDAARRLLTLDFVLHEHGPAGRWAATAAPGAELGVLGPRGSQVFPDSPTAYLLVADETGLPDAERFLAELPARTDVQLLVVGTTSGAGRALAARTEAAHWLDAPDPTPAAGPLLDALERAELAPGTFVWGAGEAGVMRALRSHLREPARPALSGVHVRGYWRLGVAGALPDEDQSPVDAKSFTA